MTVWEYVIGAMIIVFSIIIIAVVLLQESRQGNLGVISGGADSFMDKGKARTLDALLSRWTKWLAISFFLLVFAGMMITKFLGS